MLFSGRYKASNSAATCRFIDTSIGRAPERKSNFGQVGNLTTTSGNVPLPLHSAVAKNDLESIKVLLSQGSDIYEKNETGMNCLHVVAQNGNVEVAELLFKNISHVNSKCSAEYVDGQKYFEGYTPLHFSIEKGNDKLTELLIFKGADVNANDNLLGNSPLHVAVSKGFKFSIDFLLSHGCDVNLQNHQRFSALHIAVQKGNIDVMVKLLIQRANVNLTDINGDSVLHKACRSKNRQLFRHLLNFDNKNLSCRNMPTCPHSAPEYNCTKIVEVLLRLKSNVNLVNNYGDSALHLACRINNLQMVQLLLNNKCNVNIRNESFSTALHVASQFSGAEIVALLLQAGADIDSVNEYGNTPLLIASTNGNVKVVRILLINGCDVYFQNNNQTAVYLASKHGCLEVVEVLLKSGINAEVCNQYDNSPLHIACKMCNHSTYKVKGHSSIKCKINYVKIVHLLVQYGCNINMQNKDRYTPLHYAVENNCIDLAEILLQYKADISLVERSGCTVLHFASRLLCHSFFQRPLNYGYNVSALNSKSETPLHDAAEKNDVDIVKLLLKAGANPNSCNAQGITPFHYACNNIKTVSLLIKFGFNVNFTNGDNTALMFAVINNKPDIIELLLLAGAKIDFANVSSGNTALHYACEKRNIEIVKILIRYGCSIDITNKGGLSPVVIAAINNAFDIAELLFDFDCDISLPEFVWIYNIRELSNTLFRCLIKRNVLDPSNSIVLIKNLKQDDLDLYREDCEDEIKRLKAYKILHTSFTLYDLIKKDFNSFMTCLKNDHVSQALEVDLVQKFPMYYTMMRIWFDKGLRRKALLEECNRCFSKLLNKLPKLPFECIEIILNQLEDKDLIIFIHIVSPLYTPLPHHRSLH